MEWNLQILIVMDGMFASLQNSYIEALTLNVMAIRGGSFGV